MWETLIYSIWNQRNRVLFKGRRVDPDEIFTLVQLQVWSWMKRKVIDFTFTYSNWVMYPLNCLHSLSY